MSKKNKLTNTIDMLLGKGEDTIDVTDERVAMDDLKAEADKLEAHLAEVKANETDEERKVREFGEFKLTLRAKELLDRACENVGSNMGSNTMDEQSQKKIQERAALFAACNNNLADVVDAICEGLATEDPREASSVIYSTCFAVQKAANFIANLWYRRALDPVADQDLGGVPGVGTVVRDDGTTFAADRREEQREPPVGLGNDDPNAGELDAAYDIRGPEDLVLEAHTDLHMYLQLVVEVFGWDPERPMPFCYVTEDNGATFTPVFNAMQALDISEVKSRESRRRREARQTQALAAAIAARRKLLKAAAK